jgi:hypothetical protein
MRRKGSMPLRSYIARAKMFGYLMILVAIGIIIHYTFPGLLNL